MDLQKLEDNFLKQLQKKFPGERFTVSFMKIFGVKYSLLATAHKDDKNEMSTKMSTVIKYVDDLDKNTDPLQDFEAECVKDFTVFYS